MGHTRMKATLAAIVLVGVFFSKVQCDSNGTGDCNSVTTSTTSTGVTITSSNGYSISSITYANGTLASMKNLSSSSITNLQPFTKYILNITNGNETCSKIITTNPSMPEFLSLKNVQKNSISLEWTPPANMTGADFTYNITYSSSQGAWSVTNSTAYANLVSLVPGTNYTISVVTVAGGNYTSLPAIISSYTRPERIPLGNITVINNHSTSSLPISWNQPPGIVELYTIAIQGAVNQTKNSTTAQPVTFTSLLPGREYTVTITTASGPYNETSDPVTGVTYPSMPESLNLKKVQKNSISLEWTPPANMTGADLIYNITYSSSQGAWSVTNSTAYANLVSLVPGTNYTIRIVTVAAGNYTSLPGIISSFTRPEQIPPGNITVINNHSTSSLQISWNQPPGIVELYTIAIQGAVNQTQNSTTVEPVTFKSLLPGREYTFTITTASGPYNETSDPVTGVTYPSMPEFPSLKNVQKNSISLEWTPPANMTGANFFYNITYTSSQGAWSVTNSTAYANLVSLAPGTNYTISIVTVTAGNYTSLPAFISSYTRPEKIPPGNITVTNNSSTSSLQVSWIQPPGNVELYRITIQGAVSQTQNRTTVQPFYFTSLLPGREYNVTITTTSGPYSVTSDPAGQATYPLMAINLTSHSETNSISLTWGVPGPMVGAVFTYIVSYTSSYGSMSVTASNESATLASLMSGTKYTISVETVAARSYRSSPLITDYYTWPEKIPPGNITVTNNRSTSSLQVSWIQPPGNVELYRITIQGAVSQTQNSTSVQPLYFTGLLPGREYNVTITTTSGPYSVTSDPVGQATYPSMPRSLRVLTVNTNNLSLEWGQPPDMNDIAFTYNITYYSSQAAWSITSNSTSASFVNLTSGTNYTIQVASVAARSYMSSSSTISSYTKPHAVKHLSAPSIGTRNASLLWYLPDEYQSTYSFRVQAACSNSTPQNQSVLTSNITIQDLIPGESCKFLVFTSVANLIESEGVPQTVCTDADQVTSLECSPVAQQATLTLSWSCPKIYTGFNISVAGTNDHQMNIVSTCTPVNVTGLSFGRIYTVAIETLSCGKASVLFQKSCKTSVINPQPPDNPNFSITSQSPGKLLVKFSDFPDTNGPIVAYAVLVTIGSPAPLSLKDYLGKTYDDSKKNLTTTYVSTIKEIVQTRKRSTRSTGQEIVVGDGSTSRGYLNGPLDPLTPVTVSVGGFTHIVFTSPSGVINGIVSFVSFSSFNSTVLPSNTNTVSPVDNTGAIVGGILGAIAGLTVIALAILGTVLWKRRRQSDEKLDTFSGSRVSRHKKTSGITLDNFEAFVKKQRADTNLGFEEDYENLQPVGINQPKHAAELPENRVKNRYNNVLPYDVSRVKLSCGPPGSSNDYMNANYIPGYNSQREFIAAQGPLPNTVADFWRMIWEQQIYVIIMLTKCVELGKVKCDHYWPKVATETKTYGDAKVTLARESVLPDWTVRDLMVHNNKSGETRQIRQFHFTAWPDHGVPVRTDVLINFRHLIRDYMKEECPVNSPTLVHCSAGVGRTGTFIAIDRLIYQMEAEKSIDIFAVVHNLRMHRTLMVQTGAQYIFLHQCVLDMIKAQKQSEEDTIYENSEAVSIYENITVHADSRRTKDK